MIGAIWLLLAPASAEPAREAVMTLLDAYETPVDAAAVEALGEGAAAQLVAISNDPAVPPTRRARAIAGLRHVTPTDEVASALRAHLRGSEPLLQRHAALSLARLGDDAVGDLTPALASPDAELRVAAGQALGQIGSRRARKALSARIEVEAEPRVKAALAQALEAP